MKLINKSNNKKYKSSEVLKWAKDMQNNLQDDLYCYQKDLNLTISSNNFNTISDSLFVSHYIEWFLDNYFGEKL